MSNTILALDPSHAPPVLPLFRDSETHDFTFTGSGREYFRIWVVNLMLTVATLGIYSAWAKVRRLQYFNRNTRFGGAVFDFHGDPKTILKGRLVAVGVLLTYQYAFGFSILFGTVVVLALLTALPWMLRSALRFRLQNTSYRGLRFHFGGTLPGAYGAYLPVILLLFLPTLLLALLPPPFVGLVFPLYLAWPLLHARIKRYQQDHLEYGGHQTQFSATNGNFFRIYFFALLFAMLGFLMAVGLFFAGTALMSASDLMKTELASMKGIAVALVIFLLFVLAYACLLLIAPYLQVRITNLVWNHTSFPHMDVRSSLRVPGYFRLQVVNTLLTLLTFGLFRPFAVVRSYRYRLAHTAVICAIGLEELAGESQGDVGAAGDSTAEFLGIDLSF